MSLLLVVPAFAACGGALVASSDGDAVRGDGGIRTSGDGGLELDGTADVGAVDGESEDAQLPGDLLAPCNTGVRDVYFVDVEGVRGSIPIGEQTCTNIGYDFVPVGPMEIDVNSGSNRGGSVQILTLTDALPSPGTYSATAPLSAGPEIEVSVGDEGCGASAGTFTIFALEAADGGQTPSSLVVSFDLTCTLDAYGDGDSMRGCLRYAAP